MTLPVDPLLSHLCAQWHLSMFERCSSLQSFGRGNSYLGVSNNSHSWLLRCPSLYGVWTDRPEQNHVISSFNTPAYLKQERNQFMTLDHRIEGNSISQLDSDTWLLLFSWDRTHSNEFIQTEPCSSYIWPWALSVCIFVGSLPANQAAIGSVFTWRVSTQYLQIELWFVCCHRAGFSNILQPWSWLSTAVIFCKLVWNIQPY